MGDVDKSDMINTLRKFPDMIEEALELGDDATVPKEFVENIVIVGMGGSGFNGDLLKSYLYDVPIQIHAVKDYTLPKFVNRKSLIFAISYSGNTEETLTAYRTAIRRGCKIISISSGGKLEELAGMNKNSHILVPKGLPPRLSTPYLFIPILNVLSLSGIIDDQEDIIESTVDELKGSSETIEDTGKELAGKVKGKIPIIYSSTRTFCLAEKWKTDINENAKTHAFYNILPEFNHNEISAYENPMGDFHVIMIKDTEDHLKVKDRVEIFKKLMRPHDVPIIEIAITGKNYLTRLMSTIWMGLYLAYYLALEYGIDPTPVETIEKLKKELAK